MAPQIHQTTVDMHGKGVVWHDWKRILYKSLSTGAKETNHSIRIKKT